VLTKSALVLRDLDVFTGRPARIGITLTTLDERLRELSEPGAASVQERLGVVESARRVGLQTGVMFGPLLPFLSDSQEAIDALLERAADLKIDRIGVDAINPRPRVWPAVAEIIFQVPPARRDPSVSKGTRSGRASSLAYDVAAPLLS